MAPFSSCRRSRYVLVDGRQLARAPGVQRQHQMARKALHQPAGAQIVEALLGQRCRQRLQARLLLAHGDQADRGAEHEPIRTAVLGRACRPGQPAAADQAAIDMDGVGPANLDRPLRRGMRQQRIVERHHADVEGAARAGERLLRLQHHGELRQVEAADMHQRAGARLGRDRLGVREGVADLPQRHQAERRRQVERGRGAGAWRAGHRGLRGLLEGPEGPWGLPALAHLV